MLLLAATTVVLFGRALAAQPAATAPELRLDVIAGRSTASQLAAGVSLGTAGYTRVALVAGGGMAWKDDEVRRSVRFDGTLRFHLDPSRANPYGFYLLGGLGALYDGFERWRGLLVVGLGLEFPSRAKGVWAAEVGLGGGLRIGLALRRSRPEAR
jgi:hypothetical protein